MDMKLLPDFKQETASIYIGESKKHIGAQVSIIYYESMLTPDIIKERLRKWATELAQDMADYFNKTTSC